MGKTYIPIESVFDTNQISSSISQIISPVFEDLAFVDGFILGDINNGTYQINIYVIKERKVSPGFINGLSLLLGNGDINLKIRFHNSNFQSFIQFDLIKLEFPRSILKPAKQSNGEYVVDTDPNQNVSIPLNFDFVVNQNLELDTTHRKNPTTVSLPPSFIADTEIMIEISELQFDFTTTGNSNTVPRADDSDVDFSPTFKGFYADNATVQFPLFWKDDGNSTAQLKGKDILVGAGEKSGEELSFTGIIEMEATGGSTPALEVDLLNDSVHLTVQNFLLEFVRNEVVQSDVSGEIKIKGLKDSNGNDAVLNFNVDWSKEGYEITVSESQGIELTIPDIVDITLYELTIGKHKGEWKFGIKGEIDRIIDIPKIGDIIPQYIDVNEYLMLPHKDNKFDITFGWEDFTATIDDKQGLELDYKKEIVLDKTFLDTLTLKVLQFHLQDIGDSEQYGIQLDTTLDANIKFGPIVGNVGGIGFNTDLTFPDGGGNLGPANVEFSFIKPNGIGLSLKDTKGFSGGGFIEKRGDGDTYGGVLHLSFKNDLEITIMGILALELPNDPDGFSFIGIIDVDLPKPLELGMGFKLSAVGGVIGLHRGMNVDYLRKGVKDDTLDQLMFPTNPVENATQIISSMGHAFPIDEDQFVFGPLALLTYGSDDLISGKLGILIEFDNPTRLAIIGVIKAALPKGGDPQLQIQVNFLGEISFNKKRILFDASLYDSRLLTYTLEGDMLLRLFYGEEQAYVISVGGFHPSFQPPSILQLPSNIKRLTISLASKDSIKVWVKAYFALTSNTVQFGAQAHAELDIAIFEIKGDVKLDVLIFFQPSFKFIALLSASFEIKADLAVKTVTVAGAYLDLEFQGPSPFHLQGKGKVDFGPVTKKVKINETFGKDESTSLPLINVYKLMCEKIEENEEPWEAILPQRTKEMVDLADIGEEAGVVIDPHGRLRISQLVAPLDVKLEKFNNGKVKGGDKIGIEEISIDEAPVDKTDVRDQFAPAQFFKKDKSQLLDLPAYKKYKSGKETTSPNQRMSSSCLRVKVATAEEITIADEYIVRTPPMNVGIDYQDTFVYNSASMAYMNDENAEMTSMANENSSFEVSGIKYTVKNKHNDIVDGPFDTKEEADDAAASKREEAANEGSDEGFFVLMDF